jgi:iron(III) transport system ATP-binding protein
MPDVKIRHLTKIFGATRVLDDVTFAAQDGQLVTLLGPSGCGKTTTLMSIAGLETPDRGTITCGDVDFFDADTKVQLAAEARNVGIVFQTYAVWPHMTVAGNVAFPLEVRRRPRSEISRRVTEVLDLVEMGPYARRYPYQLSGGQQQRVALARALAHSPDILLLDEPFSNLDAKLRERARIWFRALQRRLKLTTIFVTHDQDEALSMSDRILVMDHGRIAQEGSPEEVYRKPATPFVADFVGQCNLIAGVIESVGERCLIIASNDLRFEVTVDSAEQSVGVPVTIALRPESVHLQVAPVPIGESNAFGGRLESISFFGDHYRSEVVIGSLRLAILSRSRPPAGDVVVTVDPDQIVVLAPAIELGSMLAP